MNKVITESQIRFVVRNELKNYLVQEGFFSDFAKTGKQIFGSENIKKALSHVIGKDYKPSGEYGEIAAILTPLQVNSQSLKPAYEMLYKKDKNNKSVVSITDVQKRQFLDTITKIEKILQPLFKKKFEMVIPAPMQEAAATSPTTSVKPTTKTAQGNLNKIYTDLKTNYDNSKQKDDIAGLLINAIGMYIVSVANLVLNTKNLQPQQTAQIQKFFEKLKDHAKNISAVSPAPAAPSAGPTP